ncbi:precorrin-6A/cobalt-precorrin-6A reductase [Roseobacter sp.]|uniref:precorrin-6A/cobalt-precorrin-6A reductase n=1 Tax=Roseobacter sp. TaxID=1907202 RepID=UPI00329A06E7
MAGAREAHVLIPHLQQRGRRVIASLSQPERSFGPLSVPTRIGGFESTAAFADWVHNENVTCVIDASHAFDADVSRTAAVACAGSDLRYLRILRAPWKPSRLDNWTVHDCLRQASDDVPPGARVFTNTGRATLGAFEGFRGAVLFVRQTHPQQNPAPFDFMRFVPGTPPFSQGDEETLFLNLQISRLVCRNVGGSASMSKLLAARRIGVSVGMVQRPAAPVGATVVETVPEALAWEANR